MKKFVFILALFAVVFPCFAEIRCERAGIEKNGVRYNVAMHWNDKYFTPPKSAKEMAEYFAETSKDKSEIACATEHIYYISDKEAYDNYLYEYSSGSAMRYEFFLGENGYRDDICEESVYFSKYLARSMFDAMCNEYYDKIPR